MTAAITAAEVMAATALGILVGGLLVIAAVEFILWWTGRR